jgi:hypothetical protein
MGAVLTSPVDDVCHAALQPPPSGLLLSLFCHSCRHQWYQLGNKVVVDVYAKNQPKDAVTVQLTGSSNDKLRICIAAQPSGSSGQQQQPPAAAAAAGGEEEGEDYVLELDLFDAVLAEAPLKFEVLRTKVEVTLVKSKPNIHWHTLEKGKGPAAAGVAVPAAAPAAAAGVATPQQQQQAPANVLQYPSSKGPKDWSKVEGGCRC